MQQLILVAAGGAIGATARYGMSILINGNIDLTMNAGTLTVNLIGSLLIGLIMGVIPMHAEVPPKLYFFLVIGVLGGFTTFSSFSYENFQMINKGLYQSFILYVLLSNIGGLMLALIGFKITNNTF